jgi:hypothetical protein
MPSEMNVSFIACDARPVKRGVVPLPVFFTVGVFEELSYVAISLK